MQTTSPLSARLSTPNWLGLLIILGAVVAIAWTVRTATAGSGARIEQATQAGANLVQQPWPSDYASHVGDALPTFTLATTAPTPDPGNPMNQWLNETWLAVAHGPDGDKWVWAGAWLGCQYIDPETLSYEPIGTGKAQEVWAGLGIQQDAVLEVCRGE